MVFWKSSMNVLNFYNDYFIVEKVIDYIRLFMCAELVSTIIAHVSNNSCTSSLK